MPWEHIARKIHLADPRSVLENPTIEVYEHGACRPIGELEEQGYEMIAVLPNSNGDLPMGIFKRFVEEK
jgi:hypothetical protein